MLPIIIQLATSFISHNNNQTPHKKYTKTEVVNFRAGISFKTLTIHNFQLLFVKRQLFVVFICHMCWVVCSIISYQPQQGCCSAPHCYTSYYLNMSSFFISQCLEIKYFHLFMGHRKYQRKIINLIRFSIFLFC